MLRAAIEFEAVSTETKSNRNVLAVGSPEEWDRRTGYRRRTGSLTFVAFAEVTRELLEELRPVAVVSPALAWEFDCIDLAARLCRLGYHGVYRAMAADLPRPEVVEAEIAQLCPGLDFGIVTQI